MERLDYGFYLEVRVNRVGRSMGLIDMRSFFFAISLNQSKLVVSSFVCSRAMKNHRTSVELLIPTSGSDRYKTSVSLSAPQLKDSLN